MSLRNTNHLMSSVLSRPSGIAYDQVIPPVRPQFNPATGSWVFGLAAFAAGVAVNQMIKPRAGDSAKESRPTDSNDYSNSDIFRESRMNSLLRDTMEEESRSGAYVDNISAEVARLRDEIAALSAQKNQVKTEAPFLPSKQKDAFGKEFDEVNAKLQRLQKEKGKLSETERELKQIIASQENASPYTEFAENKLTEIQQKLHGLKSEQNRITTEYEFSRKDASDAHLEMEKLQQRLQDKITKLREAEIREQSLKRDYQVLMETVESLKTQLEFFRNKASQDQSGMTSLKILEDSSNKLNDQVSSSLYEAEQQQVALQRLAAEKADLASQLEEHKRLARHSEERMSSLEAALHNVMEAEKSLLEEMERVSQRRSESKVDTQGRAKLEDELRSAEVNIEILENKEKELLNKLKEVEFATSNGDRQSLVNQLILERDEFQRALASSDKNFKDLESNYREQISNTAKSSGDAKTELVLAAEKEEELNYRIAGLSDKVKALENERDFLKSQAEVGNLEVTNAGNDFMILMKSIHTLESEKKSLSDELLKSRSEATSAGFKLAETQRKLDSALSDEKRYSEEITSIKSSIGSNQQLSANFLVQQKELRAAQEHIQGLIVSHQAKDSELDLARRDLDALNKQLAHLGHRSNLLTGSERESEAQVSMIQNQLSQKDHLIASSKIQEDALRREVDMLRQTSASMESEQINQANAEIHNQHRLLLEAEQAKAHLEINQREESLKLSAIQSENNALKQRLQDLQEHGRNKQSLVSEIDREQSYFKSLEREAELLKHRENEIFQQLEQSRASENQLHLELRNTQAELQHIIHERDVIKRDLDVAIMALLWFWNLKPITKTTNYNYYAKYKHDSG